ncbi:MAG: acyl-CoA/acyl-ACP dehydrogenase [Dehalococcoidia bacterium]|nr:acyl-CoA/acyl-ACP dehydrogenase [Dehalococcoidia bacterium]
MTTTATETDRRQRLLELTATLADDFATRADEHDRENSFPFENFDALKQANYTSLPIPEELGGLGGDLLDLCACQERLAQGDASTALAVNMHLFAIGSMAEQMAMANPTGMLMAGMMAQQRWIIGGGFTEAEIGGNWGFPTTKAVREDRDGIAGFMLNGRKTFTSMAPIIDFFAINTSTTDEDGNAVIGMFTVPRATPGIEIIETWDTMSMRATASHDLVINDAWVPAASLVGMRQPGDADVGANIILSWFCCSVASVYLGVAVGARDFAYQWAKTRRPVLFERPISHFPGVQFHAADIEVELVAARAVIRQTAREWLGGGLRERDDLARIVMAKYVATNAAVRVVDEAMGIVGAPGIFRRHPMQRFYRDVRPGPFHPMTNDVARELIGKAALGIPMEFEPRWG